MQALSSPSPIRLHTWKRLALILLAVSAILVGLLAMHVLSTSHSPAADTHGSETHSVVVSDAAPVTTGDAHSHDATECDGGLCGGEHGMLAAACILALLVSILLLTLTLTLLRWGTWGNVASTLLALIGVRAPARPPSLIVLSISRT